MTKNPFLRGTLAVAAIAVATTPATAVDGDPRADAIRAIATKAINPAGPGCAIAVGRDGRVEYQESFGLADLTTREPITADTVFDIGSTSKQFTATAVLLLARDGKLAVSDPLRNYLPEVAAYAGDVTLAQLMHHRSGIPDYIGLLNAAGVTTREPATFPDALRALGAVKKLDFTPGSRFEYSNSNYILMSLVVERVSGKPLATFVKERYFDPLSMKATIDPLGRVPGRAHSYLMGNGRPELDDSPWEPTGDGSVQTTAGELVKFAPEYWAPRVGGPELLADRFAGAVKGPEGEYGAGMFRSRLSDGTVGLQHSGSWGSFTTGFVMIPAERLAAAATCNGTGRVAFSATDLTARALAIWRGETLRSAPKQRATGPAPNGAVRDNARWLVARLNDGRLSTKDLRMRFAPQFLRQVSPGALLTVIGGRTAARPFVVAGAVGRVGKSSGTILVRSAISWDTWTFQVDEKGRIARLSTQPG